MKTGATTVENKKAQAFAVKSESPQITIKDVDLSKRTVTGFYNTFWYFDSDYDVLVPGCSKKSINERGPNTNVAGKIKHALFHDLTKLPGKITVLKEDEQEIQGQKVKGIYFETKMLNTPDGNDTLIKYQEGVYDNHSIGFRYLDIRMIEADSEQWKVNIEKLINPEDAEKAGIMFLVREIELYEGSTVAFGANRLTPYLGSKSENKDLALIKFQERVDLIQKQLKIGALSDEAHYDLHLQLAQLKQMMVELLSEEPRPKPTPQGPGKGSTQRKVSDLIDKFQLSI